VGISFLVIYFKVLHLFLAARKLPLYVTFLHSHVISRQFDCCCLVVFIIFVVLVLYL
jgi:hypothetical protein